MKQRVVTSGFIVKKDKFLIVKRADDDTFYPSVWEIPGGKLEFGEEPYTGLKRELMEETGLAVKVISPIEIWTYTNYQKTTQYVEIDYLCIASPNAKVKLSEEHSDFAWVTFAELDDFDISPPARKLLMNNIQKHPLILPLKLK